MEETYEVNVEDSGRFHHSATCPLCPVTVQRVTERATLDALCEHMNAAHPTPKRAGH